MKKSIMLSCAIIATLAACNQKNGDNKAATQTSPATAPAPAQNGKIYTVMTELNTVPFIIRDAKQAEGISGFEYDLLTAIAEQQGFQLKFAVHPWQGLFKNLDTGKADILAGAITYTPERAKIMDFSEPHYQYRYTMMVKDGLENAKEFNALRGRAIALQRGSVSESLIPMFDSPDGKNIIYTDTIWLAAKNVISGQADGAVGSSAPLSYYAKQYASSKVKLIEDPTLPPQHYVFAVKKGNTQLVKELNEGLAKIKANGTYDKLYNKYW